MDLCKNDSNMTFEMNGGPLPSVGQFRGESASMIAEAANGGPNDGQILMMPAPSASNGHLKCTCLPSSASLTEDRLKDVEEVSAAFAEVSVALNHSRVQFNDEIQVVKDDNEEVRKEENDDEEEEEEDAEGDEMIDLAQALYAAGVRPEHLASISEENLYHQNECNGEEPQLILSDEDTASGVHDMGKIKFAQ